MDDQQVRLRETPQVAVVGMATIDYLYVLDTHPAEDSENPVRRHGVVVGGPAGRGSITAARLGGGGVSLYAMCGTGIHAEVLRRELTSEPLEINLFERAEPSQHSAVIIAADRGTRTTIWTPQPRVDSALLDALDGALTGADAALLDCTDPELSTAAIQSCRAAGVPIVIDTGGYKQSSEGFLHGVDYIAAPEKFFTGRHPGEPLDESMSRVFADFEPKVLIATQGSRGGVYLDEAGQHRYRAFEVTTEDTCGAGDTFHGALAWAVAADASVGAALDIASWAAAQKCATFGNVGIPDRSALKEYLTEHY
ncbi:PfkB family carbohydrate kinase [Nocardia arthritidis]|uniref:PfkB family carbohydrate kinase n=1 Tax=Nocardia arthritidis TaxID=228602 RepID=UPI000A98AC70|nr:PfkB family carbohydrate kinase [Nocardia arthritidis]